MATTSKPTRKASVSRKRPRSAHRNSGELQKIVQMISKMDRTLERFLSAHGRPRSPLPEYARVVAVGTAEEVAEVRGHAGIVLDAAESDDGKTYTVYFPAKQEAIVLHEKSLWDTGETVPEDVIYGGGQSHRVHVDAQGNGTVVVSR